jgi:hypothetical protein
VAHDFGLRGIVHPCPCKRAIGKGESHRLDQVDGHAETGRETQDSADIPGNVGLVECDTHKKPLAKRGLRVYQARSFRGDGGAMAGVRLPEGRPQRSADRILKCKGR